MTLSGWQHLRAAEDGEARKDFARPRTAVGRMTKSPSPPTGKLFSKTPPADEQLFILERTAWSDDAATAAEVTALQMFRDLFATEALRPGEQISVGTLTVLFTDLQNSTRFIARLATPPRSAV